MHDIKAIRIRGMRNKLKINEGDEREQRNVLIKSTQKKRFQV